MLRLLVRSGLWRLISGERFAGVRRAVLYDPGEGAPHEVVIDVRGNDAEGRRLTRRATIVDPEGQSHLTAVGALIQLERVLGLGAYPAPGAGVMVAESTPEPDASLQTLRELGVVVTVA